MSKKLKIKFHPLNKDIELCVPRPKPARLYTPEWFKKIPTVTGGEKEYANGKLKNKSPKLCMPFSDSFTTGYIQETWCEIHIGLDKDGNVSYNYSTEPKIIEARPARTFISDLYYPYEFTWKLPWAFELPKGWSALIVNPLNQTQLPFFTMSGIIESDSYFRSPFPNNLPFMINNGFQGIIPVGTPMFQIIPFRREEWVSSQEEYNEVENRKGIHAVEQFFQGGYKKIHWKKKNFL